MSLIPTKPKAPKPKPEPAGQDDTARRLTRIETKLTRFMRANGLDDEGKKLPTPPEQK